MGYTSKWMKIRNDYYDEDEHCICIDAWETAKDGEEGKIIAKVYKNKVEYIDDFARKDYYAQEKISEATKSLLN